MTRKVLCALFAALLCAGAAASPAGAAGAPHKTLTAFASEQELSDLFKRWADDIKETQGYAPNYPIIGDADLKVARLYDMIHPNATAKTEGRTAADNQTIRSVFMIGPDKKIKLILTYPMSTGRNFDEVLRVLDSMQLTAKHKVATPVNWKPGDDVIIVPAVGEEEARQKFPQGWKAPRPYLRIVPQPK